MGTNKNVTSWTHQSRNSLCPSHWVSNTRRRRLHSAVTRKVLISQTWTDFKPSVQLDLESGTI